MSAVFISRRFKTGAHPLRQVISLAKDGLVIAHVNAGDLIPDAEKIAAMLAASFEMAEALLPALREWEFKRETEGGRNGEVTPQWVYDARAALAKAGVTV